MPKHAHPPGWKPGHDVENLLKSQKLRDKEGEWEPDDGTFMWATLAATLLVMATMGALVWAWIWWKF